MIHRTASRRDFPPHLIATSLPLSFSPPKKTPYYWPSQHHTPDNIEYAIYLAKRSQRNKQKHGLEEYEVEAYNNLRKILTSKWDFVSMQADEQVRLQLMKAGQFLYHLFPFFLLP